MTVRGQDGEKGPRPAGRKSRERAKVFGPATVVTLLGFLAAYQFVEPAPPSRITIATGSPDGAYYAFAQQYRKILGRHGISLQVVPSAGSPENLEILERGTAEVAFVQGGVGRGETSGPLSSLGSVYFEPLWVFHRSDVALEDLSGLRGLRVAAGVRGSGTRAVALRVLEANGVAPPAAEILDLGGAGAAAALLGGEADAAFFVVSVASQVIQDLLRRPEVRLLSFERGDAYSRVYPFLSVLTLPRGVVDLAADLPPRDVRLVAPAAALVVNEDLHPALIDLLLQAADEVHGGRGVFSELGEFPSPRYIEFPLHQDARRYFRSGPPLLQRYLPFWAATFVDRVKVMLLPLLTLLFPLMKIVPPTYRWKVRSRIYRWYRELEEVDLSVDDADGEAGLRESAAALDRIENEVTRVTVHLSYAVELYDLRLHIAHVREKVEAARTSEGP